MYLAIFEFLGTSELLIILLIALMLFGPRKLPQVSRSIGRSIADFKRASEDFKRTWEKEVELEKLSEEGRIARSMFSDDLSAIGGEANKMSALEQAADASEEGAPEGETPESTIARTASDQTGTEQQAEAADAATAAADSSSRKRDWL